MTAQTALTALIMALALVTTACSPTDEVVVLPDPARQGRKSLEETLACRRSLRTFADRPLTHAHLSQLLWATQGITDRRGRRTAPSAGALYPLEVFVASAGGLFQYEPKSHRLVRRQASDPRAALKRAALGQEAITRAPAVFVIAAVRARTAGKYGPRATRYVHMEVGHAAQNLLLQATALDLGGVPIGAFDDQAVQQALSLPADHEPLLLVPVGSPP